MLNEIKLVILEEDILDSNAIIPAMRTEKRIEKSDKILDNGVQVEKADDKTENADIAELSFEELSKMESDLDTQIEENEKAIQEQHRKALIDRIQAKRVIIQEQQKQLGFLQQERSTQISKDTQKH